ncbi:MAG TPA: helix-turn-helix domain-containing protein [Spirochaetia bacterium]|nr:helix-turn-helix domain-containing protein [Spirochaetia bacterium]
MTRTTGSRRSWNVFDPDCPTRRVLDRIADKWTVLVVGALQDGTLRFGEVRRTVQGISQKMLTETLRGLERDGIVKRKIYASVPPKVEYSLTPLGKSLTGLLESVRNWAETHIESVLESQKAHDSARPAGAGGR